MARNNNIPENCQACIIMYVLMLLGTENCVYCVCIIQTVQNAYCTSLLLGALYTITCCISAIVLPLSKVYTNVHSGTCKHHTGVIECSSDMKLP